MSSTTRLKFASSFRDSSFPLVQQLQLISDRTGVRRIEITGLRLDKVNLDSESLRVSETLQRIRGRDLVTGVPVSRMTEDARQSISWMCFGRQVCLL